MNFDWTSDDQAFREKIREFLKRELPDNWSEIARHGPGSREQTEFSLEFCPKLAEEGLLVPHWPEEWGGTNRPTWEHFILGEEMWAAGEPRGAQYMNVNWIGPTLMQYGTEEQKQHYIPEMANGKAIWCQGFSEPNAGSDLASLLTSAKRDGDQYIINGNKIWTSYAGLADHCFLLARVADASADKADKKAGIAIFLVPMSTPGIEVRSIPSLIGHGDIHEIFFTDVSIPVTSRLGAEGEAWSIISYSLANERVGIPRYELSSKVLMGMMDELQSRGELDDPVVKVRAGAASAACEAARMLVYHAVDRRSRGMQPGTESNIARIAVIEADHAVTDFGLDFLPDTFSGQDFPAIVTHHERAIVAGIAAGAAEIQLGLIARRFLDLPRGAK